MFVGRKAGAMSYDVRFGVQTVCENNDGERFVIVHRPELDSPTYNLRDMFVACMDWDYEQGKWYPMTEVLPKIERGIRELAEHPERYERYNPPNGWGSLKGALECLRNWRAEVVADDDPVLGDGKEHFEFELVTYMWPIDALWFRW